MRKVLQAATTAARWTLRRVSGEANAREYPLALAMVVLLFPSVQAAIFAAAPERPRQFVDTSYVPPTGQTINVASGGDFQAALLAARPGDTIKLQAGATFTGPFTLPNKSGSGWIIVRTSAPDSSLPPTGARMTPARSSVLPKIVTADSGAAIQTAPGAHHYRFIGVEITLASNVALNYGLVQLGAGSSAQSSLAAVPHHLIFDRVYVHGKPDVNLRRAFALNSAWSAIIDSYISDAHEIGADSQAIAGWNGPGPFKIANCHLEGAGENVIFGGTDPYIANLVPSDIEIRGNHFYKPLSWRIQHPSYAGFPWTVKNLFELKNARRVLVEGNVLDNNWLHGQNGFAILFTPRNQDGKAPWSVVEDVTFVKNVLRHSGSGVNISGRDDNYPSQQTKRILIKDNLFVDVSGSNWGGSGRLFQTLHGTADVTIEHNTAFHTGDVIAAGGAAHTGFIYRNNLTPNNQFGVGGDSTFGNPILTLSTYFPGAVLTKSLFMGGNASVYPPGNFFPASWSAVGFVNQALGDYHLAATSPYRRAGTDGKDIGADIDALNAATAGAVSGSSSSDTTPPSISSVTATSVTASSARISWVTDEGSDSLVEYGTTTAYGSQSAFDGSLVTSHARTLAALTSDTLYHYRVRSRNAAGILAVSRDFTFQTPSDRAAPGRTRVVVDTPAAGAARLQPFTVAGWAVDPAAPTGTGVDQVHLWAFPEAGGQRFLGVANYGLSRPDVGAFFGNSRFNNSGYGFAVSGLANGRYTIKVYARSTARGTFDGVASVKVIVGSDPRMYLDAPATGTSRRLPFMVSGWAIDRAAASGSGVREVHVWAFRTDNQAGTFLGVANVGIARPDIASAFGAQFGNAGFSLEVTTSLPQTTYRIVAYARSAVTGNFDNQDANTVTVLPPVTNR